MASSKVKRAIEAFEKAVKDKALIGPTQLHYTNENSVRMAIEHNYVKARAKLERLMEQAAIPYRSDVNV